MEHYGWNDKQYMAATGALTNVGNLCAKRATAPPVEIAWQKLKEAGYKMDKEVLHTFLYVTSTFSSSSYSSTRSRLSLKNREKSSLVSFLDDTTNNYSKPTVFPTNKDAGPSDAFEEEEWMDVSTEVALCHDLLYEPTEQSTSIRVRMLVAQGNAKEAEKLLDSSEVSWVIADLIFRLVDITSGSSSHLWVFQLFLLLRRLVIFDSDRILLYFKHTWTKVTLLQLLSCLSK
jgi:hypothetical protein